jgi:hypothetical protein
MHEICLLIAPQHIVGQRKGGEERAHHDTTEYFATKPSVS